MESFLQQIKDELVSNTYRPMRVRKKEIPKDAGKVRVLSIPSIRDRVVEGDLKLILEPIFEADSQSGSYGYHLNGPHMSGKPCGTSNRRGEDPNHRHRSGAPTWIHVHNAPLFMKQSWLSVYHFDS